eukprot:TRINITY_DN5696_c0_g1_i1.p1 TRINITY_DN5696_c0_g1~~TRINITY_DN5696_c0_g1_i1.p1  ORF type:complete len:671 (+),score=105.84 TRINITY_DN5696_c0_g1_i1:428-2440(+)
MHMDDLFRRGDFSPPTSLLAAVKDSGLPCPEALVEAAQVPPEVRQRYGLSAEEAACVCACAMDFGPGCRRDANPADLLSAALMTGDECRLLRVRGLLFLVLRALRKLPRVVAPTDQDVLYASVRRHANCIQGTKIVWNRFAVATTDLNVAQASVRNPATGNAEGTLFQLQNCWGYDVHEFTKKPSIIIEPELQFSVRWVVSDTDLTLIALHLLPCPLQLPDLLPPSLLQLRFPSREQYSGSGVAPCPLTSPFFSLAFRMRPQRNSVSLALPSPATKTAAATAPPPPLNLSVHTFVPAVGAQLKNPRGLALHHATGDVYVADTENHVVRCISAWPLNKAIRRCVITFLCGWHFRAGVKSVMACMGVPPMLARDIASVFAEQACVVKTFAGAWKQGYRDGVANYALFNRPHGVAVDQVSGDVYVADTHNHCIRVVSQQGEVRTIAGTGCTAYCNDVARSAHFSSPTAVAVRQSVPPTVLVADTGNHSIREIHIATGVVTTLAGRQDTHAQRRTCVSYDGFCDVPDVIPADFRFPTGIAVEPESGAVLIADEYGCCVWRLDTKSGEATVIAGKHLGYRNGPAHEAKFYRPCGVEFDPATGNVLIADTYNHRVRVLTAQGEVHTLAGSSVQREHEGQFYGPSAVVVDQVTGCAVVADTGNSCLKLISVRWPRKL